MTPEELDALCELVDAVGTPSAYETSQAQVDLVASVPVLIAALREAWDEATDGPTWDAVRLRSSLVAVTVERDDAEAALDRVRALCDEYVAAHTYNISDYTYTVTPLPMFTVADIRAAIEGSE